MAAGMYAMPGKPVGTGIGTGTGTGTTGVGMVEIDTVGIKPGGKGISVGWAWDDATPTSGCGGCITLMAAAWPKGVSMVAGTPGREVGIIVLLNSPLEVIDAPRVTCGARAQGGVDLVGRGNRAGSS